MPLVGVDHPPLVVDQHPGVWLASPAGELTTVTAEGDPRQFAWSAPDQCGSDSRVEL